MFQYTNRNSAFTLVELVVVVIILGILATISFVSYIGYIESTKDSVIKLDFDQLQKSLDLYYAREGRFPPETGDGIFGEQSIVGIREITQIPKDPFTKTNYTYSVGDNGKSYILSSTLANGTPYIVSASKIKNAGSNNNSTQIEVVDNPSIRVVYDVLRSEDYNDISSFPDTEPPLKPCIDTLKIGDTSMTGIGTPGTTLSINGITLEVDSYRWSMSVDPISLSTISGDSTDASGNTSNTSNKDVYNYTENNHLGVDCLLVGDTIVSGKGKAGSLINIILPSGVIMSTNIGPDSIWKVILNEPLSAGELQVVQ